VNVAVTDRAALIVTRQELVPVQAPPHPEKDELVPAAAVSVTTVPDRYDSEQSVPQLIPAGEDVTVPAPVPAFATLSV
jgi:hypothetical protein